MLNSKRTCADGVRGCEIDVPPVTLQGSKAAVDKIKKAYEDAQEKKKRRESSVSSVRNLFSPRNQYPEIDEGKLLAY